MANTVCFHAVGRRKKAIARVRLIPGEGNIVINKRTLDEYFGYETLKTVVRQPLALTETLRETLRELRALGMTTAELDAIYREEEEK